MHYVVMDLEWNQAMSSKSSVFNKLPIHLRGEIIEIGAVKLNEDMTPGEEFQIDVKPMYFRRMSSTGGTTRSITMCRRAPMRQMPDMVKSESGK